MSNLYLKYRPKSFKDIIGNESVVDSLKGLIKKKDAPHVYLFHGSTGCGKTTLARILAKELNCKGENVKEINFSNFRGIDTVRDIINKSKFMPIGGGNKVYIIDEAHKMTNDAQNGFLKDLEDTPKHVYYILCTTDPQKLLAAVKNRCLPYQVNLLQDDEMQTLLETIVKAEKETLDKKVYKQIILTSLGHPRLALQLLDQVLVVSSKKRIKLAEKFEVEKNKSNKLGYELMNKNINWKSIGTVLRDLKGQEPEGIRRAVMGYAQAVLLDPKTGTLNRRAALILTEFAEPTYNNGFVQITYACACVVQSA